MGDRRRIFSPLIRRPFTHDRSCMLIDLLHFDLGFFFSSFWSWSPDQHNRTGVSLLDFVQPAAFQALGAFYWSY
jgi:hypothetical protein